MEGVAMSYLRPDTQAPQRPTADELRRYASDEADANERGAILYLKSYLVMRATIGFLGSPCRSRSSSVTRSG